MSTVFNWQTLVTVASCQPILIFNVFVVDGVTFLAFGNGAPDVISAIVAITNSNDGDAGLAIGALFGEYTTKIISTIVWQN